MGGTEGDIGGIARDSNGTWRWGLSGSMGNTDVDSVELQALVKCMKITWERRTPKVIVEINSANVFNWVLRM